MPIRIRKRRGYLRWTPADSFSAVSLTQYVVNAINNGSVIIPTGGLGGSPYSIPTPGNPGSAPTADLAAALLVDPDVLGLMVAYNLDSGSSNWVDINTTLGVTKGKTIYQAFITQSQALYVVGGSADTSFLAKAPTVGGDFVEIFNKAVADDYFGTGATNTLRIQSVTYNPLLPDEVIFRGVNSNGAAFFRVLPDGSIERIKTLNSLASIPTDLGIATYGDLFFVCDGNGYAYSFPLDYSAVTSLGLLAAVTNSSHVRAGVLPYIYIAINTGSAINLRISLDNGVTHTDVLSTGIDLGADATSFIYKMAVDAAGAQIITRTNIGGVLYPYASLDGGNTYSAISFFTASGLWVFAFAGSSDLDSRWLAVGSGKVWYNNKGTTGDWVDVTGDLTTTSPTFSRATVILPIGATDNPIIPIDITDQQQAAVDFNDGYSAPAAASDVVEDAIVNGVTDKAPSQNAVYDALQLKEDTANKKTTMTGNTTSNVFFLTAKAIYDWAIGLFSQLGHTHAASDIASGTIATARLGSGTADATTYLRGDQTWVAASGGISDAPSDGNYYGRLNATWTNLKTYFDTLYQAILTAANLGDFIVALTGKTTPVDADSLLLSDSAASDDAKKVTWANIKATLKTYFDSLYAVTAKGVTNGDSHDHNGGDGAAITEAAITLADNTTNDASTSKHGFLKKLSNVATEFMSGTGAWTRVVSAIDSLFSSGLNAGVAASTTNYLNLASQNFGLQSAVSNIVVNIACTLSDLYVTTNSTQSGTGSLVFTVLKNGVATGLTITVAAGTAANTFSDTTHSVSLVAGDAVTLQVVNNATATSALIIRIVSRLTY